MQHCGRFFSYSVGKNMEKEEKRCILFVHLGKYPPRPSQREGAGAEVSNKIRVKGIRKKGERNLNNLNN